MKILFRLELTFRSYLDKDNDVISCVVGSEFFAKFHRHDSLF
jgi:hypothetical protein